MKIYTQKKRNAEEFKNIFGREPSETDLAVKRVAEKEAANQIDATPSGQYAMEEIVEPHWDAVAREIGIRPLDGHKEIFRTVYKKRINEENSRKEIYEM
jgi:hypothetical protein